MIKDILTSNEEVTDNTAFLAELRTKFPQFFSESKYDEEGNLTEAGGFDVAKFNSALEDANIQKELTSGYSLDWIGKQIARRQSGEKSKTVIVPDNTHNNLPENQNSNNLFLTGDNLEILRHLQANYMGKVDFIYIDPPYNTGSDGFVYNDKFEWSDDELMANYSLDDNGLKRLKSIQGRSSHAAWLTFMYPRLWLARKLLKDTGVIFVSIDDNEQANLKLLMDEIFGEGNFVGEIIHKNNSMKNQANLLSISTEYILAFRKNSMIISDLKWRIPKKGTKDIVKKFKELQSKNYSLEDISSEIKDMYSRPKYSHLSRWNKVDERGVFKDSDLSRAGGRKDYTIINPNTGTEVVVPTRGWGKSYEELLRLQQEDLIWYGDEKTPPGQKNYIESDSDMVPDNFFYYDNSVDTRNIFNLFGASVFENPKPVEMIKTLIRMATDENSIVFDFFAGSATTADAVMQLNAEDGGRRQYILATLDEEVKSEVAQNAGYTTIDQISRERIKRSAKKIRDENSDWKGDTGFKHYRFVEPSIQTIDEIVAFDPEFSLDIFNDMISPFSSQALEVEGGASGDDTILSTYLVTDGYTFDEKVEILDISGYALPIVKKQRAYIIQEGWSTSQTKTLVNMIGKSELPIKSLVVYGYSLQLEDVRELRLALTQSENKVNLLVRY